MLAKSKFSTLPQRCPSFQFRRCVQLERTTWTRVASYVYALIFDRVHTRSLPLFTPLFLHLLEHTVPTLTSWYTGDTVPSDAGPQFCDRWKPNKHAEPANTAITWVIRK